MSTVHLFQLFSTVGGMLRLPQKCGEVRNTRRMHNAQRTMVHTTQCQTTVQKVRGYPTKIFQKHFKCDTKDIVKGEKQKINGQNSTSFSTANSP